MTGKRGLSAKDTWALKFVGDPQLSPDGELVVFTLTTIDSEKNGYRTGLFLAPADGSCPARQLTNLEATETLVRDSSPRWSACGNYIAFLSNRSGRNQIWVLPLAGGEAFRVTSMEDAVSDFSWAPDSSRLVFACREPGKKEAANKDVRVIKHLRYKFNGIGFTDPRPRHLWTVDFSTRAVNQITSGIWEDFSPVFSPDGGKVAFLSCREDDWELRYYPDIWVLDLKTSQLCKLTKSKGQASSPRWSPCGGMIAYFGNERADEGASNTELFIVPSSGGEPVSLTRSFDRSMDGGVTSDAKYDGAAPGPRWSADGKLIYVLVTDGGQSYIYSVDAGTKAIERVVGAERFSINSYDMVDTCCGPVFAYNGGTQLNPGDIYTGKGMQQLTHVNDEFLAGIDLAGHERFTYEGDQGWPIEGWVMKPVGYVPGKKYPVIVQIHGGPASTVGEGFFIEYQTMAARGYGVFYMNFRGSKGYGEKFAKGIIGDWGGGEYRDIMAGTDFVEKMPWVDPSRIYVTGGSFGGYETNWIVGQSNRFRAAVTQRSISNMYTKYGVSDIGWYGNKAGMGGADLWDSEEFIMSRSPIRYAPKVRTPILILHSELDYRCPMEQAEQWFVALKRLGNVEVEFVRFAGENHELSRSGKPQNRAERIERIIDWFDRHNP